MVRMKTLVMVLLLIAAVSHAEAASKGQVAGALADYDRYKILVLKDLKYVDTLRTQRSGPSTDLLPLFKEVAKASHEANQLYHDQMLMEMMSGSPHALSRLFFTLHVALEQLAKMLAYEITYQSDQEWRFMLSLRAQAAELFRVADQELATLKAAVQIKEK
jgi:pyoverdine/dityrosine biosynthesis protein Dit1